MIIYKVKFCFLRILRVTKTDLSNKHFPVFIPFLLRYSRALSTLKGGRNVISVQQMWRILKLLLAFLYYPSYILLKYMNAFHSNGT